MLSAFVAVLLSFFAAMKLASISNFASAPTLNSTLIPGVTVTLLFAGFACLAAGKIRRVSLATLINE